MTNLVIWNVLIILAIKYLSSGRSAILGYTMPIFSALLGAWFFGTRLRLRNWIGVAAAALGVGLLLHLEPTALGGSVLMTGMPAGATAAIFAAKYGSDAPFAARNVVFTTLLSMLTLPLWAYAVG